MINSIFSVQLIPIFTIYLADLTFLSFSALTVSLNSAFGSEQFILHCVLLIAYFLLAIMVTTYYASNTVNETSATLKIISKIIVTGQLSKDSVNSFSQLLTQFRYRNPILRNEFFTIDWRLFVSVSLSNFRRNLDYHPIIFS